MPKKNIFIILLIINNKNYINNQNKKLQKFI